MIRPAPITLCSANALIRANLADTLRDLGAVVAVASAEELWARLQVAPNGLLLADISAHKQASFRRILALSPAFPGIRTILFNAPFDRNILQQSLNAGVWGILTHAAALEDFRDAVKTVSDSRRYFSPDIPLALMGRSLPPARQRLGG